MKILHNEISKKPNSNEYILIIEDKEVGNGYIFNRDINPIEVYIHEEHRSNGYGKMFFNSLLDIVKGNGTKGIIFELTEDQSRFKNIICQAGAVLIGKLNETSKYLLKLT